MCISSARWPLAPCFSSAAAWPARAAWMRSSASLIGSRAFQNKRHGSVVGQRDRHMGLKHAGLDPNGVAARGVHEMLIERPGLLGGGGSVKARPPALAGVAVKGELRDYQQRSSGLDHAPVHFA